MERIFYMKSITGNTVRVPESKLKEWAKAQQALKNGDRSVIASGERIPSKEELMKKLKRK